MNLLTAVVFSQLLTLGTISNVSVASRVSTDELLQELGRMIGEAIRGTPDDDLPLARPMPAEVVRNAGKLAEKDRKELNDRARALADAYRAWLLKTCELTTEQQAKVNEQIDALIVSEVENIAKKPDLDRQNQMLPQTLPLLFTKPSGLAKDFQKKLDQMCASELLTEKQLEQLNAALREREKFLHQAYLTYLMSILDQELFLTADQRAALIAELGKRKSQVTHPMYSFQPQAYYLPIEAISNVIPQTVGKNILSQSQRKQLFDLSTEFQGGQQLVFQTASGREEWDRQIAEACESQRDRFLHAAAVRVTYFEKEMQLSPEQVEYLRIAGKGAAVRALGDWKDATRHTIEQMEQQMVQMGGNVGFCAEGMPTRSIDQNEIWADAVSMITKGTSQERVELRKAANRDATAQAVLAMLDEELWLTPDQREPLKRLISKTLPTTAIENPYEECLRDLILLVYPLMKVPEKSKSEVLSDSQIAVWEQMQSYFRWQKANSYVEIPLRNQGGSFSFSLSP